MQHFFKVLLISALFSIQPVYSMNMLRPQRILAVLNSRFYSSLKKTTKKEKTKFKDPKLKRLYPDDHHDSDNESNTTQTNTDKKHLFPFYLYNNNQTSYNQKLEKD